jgi:hypothetical protein
MELIMTDKPSPYFNNNPPPNPAPHRAPTPHGGQVQGDEKFLGNNLSRERGIERRERAKRLADK